MKPDGTSNRESMITMEERERNQCDALEMSDEVIMVANKFHGKSVASGLTRFCGECVQMTILNNNFVSQSHFRQQFPNREMIT